MDRISLVDGITEQGVCEEDDTAPHSDRARATHRSLSLRPKSFRKVEVEFEKHQTLNKVTWIAGNSF